MAIEWLFPWEEIQKPEVELLRQACAVGKMSTPRLESARQ
jgi:hypothetical protein